MAGTQYLKEAEAARRIGVSARTLTRWRNEGTGPSFCRMGPRFVAYRDIDIESYAAGRVFVSRAAEMAQPRQVTV